MNSTDDSLIDALAAYDVDPPATLLPSVLVTTGLACGRFETDSPLGRLDVVYGADGVRRIDLLDQRYMAISQSREPSMFRTVDGARPDPRFRSAVEACLSNGRSAVAVVDWSVVTPFQRSVLEAAASIPPGEVRPYGWIAAEIGRPRAQRAVGTALATNPIPILLPCHRITKGDGSIGNYLYGPPAKRHLLAQEGVDLALLDSVGGGSRRLLGSTTGDVYCHPTCRHARQIREPNRVWFLSGAAAHAAGYRGCLDCRPVG